MKRFRYISALLFLTATLFACNKDDNPPKDPNDDSPGVDEYFRMQVNGTLWEVNSDNDIGAAVATFGSGTKLTVSATRSSDSTYCLMGMRYFLAQDTVFSSGSGNTLGFQFYYTNGVYTDRAGSLSIQRSSTGGMQVYDGNFNMLFVNGFTDTDTISLSNGSFKVVRLI